jgi:phosphoglycerol transferase MdoB-like AlkP superfamily enzyme
LQFSFIVTAGGVPTRASVEPHTRRWQGFPSNLRFFLLLIGLTLLLFAVLRLGLVLRTRNPVEATWRQVASAFVVGMRFDLSTAAYLLAPVIALCYLPWTAPQRSRRTRRVFLWTLTCLLSIASFILLCEYEFFQEFQSRYNQLAVRYLDHPTIVGGMVWYQYPVVRYVACGLGIGTLIHLALRGALRLSFGRFGGESERPVLSGHRHRIRELSGAAVIAAVIVIGARGGLGGEPLAWGDAFHSSSDYANQVSLNGLWCLGKAIREVSDRGAKSAGWGSGKVPIEEARQIARSMILAPGEQLIDPNRRTVLRQGDNGSSLRLASATGRPLNVVVVMMESFSARFCGAVGAPRSFTPAFDAIAKDGVLFDRALSAGSHTHQGIFATLLGFPNLPGYETLMSSAVSNQHFCSLPEIFQEKGYQTFFLYNGDFSWDNMRGFFTKQGVKTFVGGDDIPEAEYRDHVWGVSDGDLFKRCNKEFEAAHKKGPFFAAVMTLSNHAPFEVPPVPGAGPVTGQGEFNKRLEAQRYSDWAVGRFIEEAKTLRYFNETLFVFVGDHGYAVPPQLTEVQLLYHHVPLLFYAPAMIKQPRVDHRLATQMNIAPSIVGLLGMKDAPHASWARSLFNDSYPDENFAVFKQSGGGRAVAMAQGDRMLVLGSAKGVPLYMNFSLAWPPSIKPTEGPDDNAEKKRMERELRAYVQAALTDLTEQRAGPVGRDAD